MLGMLAPVGDAIGHKHLKTFFDLLTGHIVGVVSWNPSTMKTVPDFRG